MAEQKTVTFIITRPDRPDSAPYEETFHVTYRKNMNIISGFMEIQKNPVNATGEKTTPVQWDMNCLEEVCGACSMVINGTARQSCAALVDHLEQPIDRKSTRLNSSHVAISYDVFSLKKKIKII